MDEYQPGQEFSNIKGSLLAESEVTLGVEKMDRNIENNKATLDSLKSL